MQYKITVVAAQTNESDSKIENQVISLNFQNIATRSALQILGQFSNRNLIISENVKGHISLYLKDVPWRKALDVIMQSQDLGFIDLDKVLFIATLKEIADREKQRLLMLGQQEDYEPLQTQLIKVNYGKASDIANLLKQKNASLLTKRGNIGFDIRTNTLWLEEVPEKIIEIKRLIRALDVPVQQVLIAARIVNIDKKYEKNLGIRWHIGQKAKTNIDSQGSLENTAENANATRGLHLDLPDANSPVSNPIASGLVVLKLADNILLDLELSALENEGNAKIIATPQIVTANQKEALIEAGEEIPYQRAASSGATAVSFKKAALSLHAVPQITPDHRIILELTVNQDKRGPEIHQGVTIDTREIKTQVIVKDGQTIVLGGIYQQSNSKDIEGIPVLDNMPLIGKLFRHTKKLSEQRELLIFVTPKILKSYE